MSNEEDMNAKERRFWFRHGYNLALIDAVNAVMQLAELPQATNAERLVLHHVAEVIRRKAKMDNDSEESKEVDAALLAQCTCGGVSKNNSCDIDCAIFSGTKPMSPEQAKENRAAGEMQHFTEIGAPSVCKFDKELVAKAQELITKAINYIHLCGKGSQGTARLTEENLNLLRMAIDTPKPVIHDEIKQCPHCESTEITESVVEKDSSLFEGDDRVEVKYKVHLSTCTKCDLGWLDYRAEEAEMQALYKALYAEVVSLRHVSKAHVRELVHHRSFREKAREMFGVLNKYFS